VIVNRSGQSQSVTVPVAGYLHEGISLNKAYEVGNGGASSVSVSGGEISTSVGPMSAVILLSGTIDLLPKAAPANLHITNEGSDSVSLEWDPVPGSAGYTLYRSPVSGGGWVSLASGLGGTSYTDNGLTTGKNYYSVVTSSDSVGNESAHSNEVAALPHYTIGWANLQWPPSLNHTISATNRTDTIYGQVWIDGVTSQPGPTPGLIAQVGFGPEGSNPDGNSNWIWEYASFNVDLGNNDEFMASLLPDALGTFDYVYRYSTTNEQGWLYADLNGPIPTGNLPPNPGKLTVKSSGDLTLPAAPSGLSVSNTSPLAISLEWDVHPNHDGDLAGFEVYRDGALIATVLGAATNYTDMTVVESVTYDYYILAIDGSYNRSAPSNTVTATASPRTVKVVFHVTVPAWTPTSQSVHIAGSLHLLNGNLPEWDSTAVSLNQVGVNEWEIILAGVEGTNIQYKYTLGSPDFFDVEKGGSCDEIPNRTLTLNYGTTGTQNVNDTVLNWRNVPPCGN
jgi:hypothetical protein